MPKPLTLKSGVVAVTGGSRGLGAAMTCALLKRGFRVAALSRSGSFPEGLEDGPAVRERLIVRACDVNDDADLAACFSELDREEGGLRVLVNNAGVHTMGASARYATADFEALLRTNTTAVFAASREAYPYLKRQGGLIMNIGSCMEVLGAAHNAAYSSSKAALGALTRSLASEWARDDIIVLDVAPGYVFTDMTTEYLAREDVKAYFARQTVIGRPGHAAEFGELVAGLLETDLTLLTGQTLRADGGHSVAHGHIR